MRTPLSNHTGLIALEAQVKLDPTAAGPLPTKILMLKWGENETAQGPVKVGLKTLAASKLWDGLGFGEVAIDYNHNTVPGHESYKGEPAKIASPQHAHPGRRPDCLRRQRHHHVADPFHSVSPPIPIFRAGFASAVPQNSASRPFEQMGPPLPDYKKPLAAA